MSLTLVNVNKSYQQGSQKLEILKNVNGDVKTGELISIVGQSGSGKSTLLSLLAGLDRPDSGKIIISGVDISTLNQKDLTEFRGKKIGIVFQQFHLLNHLKAIENVMLPLEILGDEQARDKAETLLNQVGLGHRLEHLPYELSGGECQRVAIARALVTKPEILLADEPSGNLDVKTGQQVMNLFLDVVRQNKITTILVTHSPELAQLCDRQLQLVNGDFQ